MHVWGWVLSTYYLRNKWIFCIFKQIPFKKLTNLAVLSENESKQKWVSRKFTALITFCSFAALEIEGQVEHVALRHTIFNAMCFYVLYTLWKLQHTYNIHAYTHYFIIQSKHGHASHQKYTQSQHTNRDTHAAKDTYAHPHKHTHIRMARWASILRLSLMTKNPQSGQHGWI